MAAKRTNTAAMRVCEEPFSNQECPIASDNDIQYPVQHPIPIMAREIPPEGYRGKSFLPFGLTSNWYYVFQRELFFADLSKSYWVFSCD